MSFNFLFAILALIPASVLAQTDARPAFQMYPTTAPRYNPSLTNSRRLLDPKLMYPYDKSDYLRNVNSMKQFHDQPLHFRLPFFGFAFNYIWVHKDGYVSFNRGLKSYQFPVSFPVVPSDPEVEEDPSLIGIFFAHQDIPPEVNDSGVYMRVETVEKLQDPEYKEMILENFDKAMAGSGGFVPRFIIIVTWKNMTFPNRRLDKPLKTNTYQMVIGTDEISTFVFFNYEWITWITHLDNFDGLNGPQAFVGFNAGNSTRSFEFAPYSQNPRISLLPLIGYANNIQGRSVFQINEVLFQGSCSDISLDPTLPDRMGLTTSVNFILSLGGEALEVTGPCFSETSRISCRFDTKKVKGHFISTNVAICVTPQILFEGYVDLTVTVEDRTEFYTRMYIQSPESRHDFDVWINEADYAEINPDLIDKKEHVMTLRWKADILGDSTEMVTISIWGYQEIGSTLYPRLNWLVDLIPNVPNTGTYLLDLNQLPELNLDRYDYHFGFIGVNVTTSEITATLWSKTMPLGKWNTSTDSTVIRLGWLFRHYWRREFGQDWKRNFCTKWFEREMDNDYFATTVFRCPCTLHQAMLDKGRFAPDEQCNVIDRKCDSRFIGVQHCVRTARPSIGGSGQQCCYDDYGELIRSADTMYSGRPSRAFVYGKHPFKMQMMTPTFSYWQHDVMPFYYCCKWADKEDDSDTCLMFNYFRTTQDCSSYQPVAVASVFGDPHIMTFDQMNYTFNGKGEYVLVHTNNPIHKLDIHGRFEQLPGLNATHLTAVSVADNVSSIVEFRLRPDGCRWFNQIFLIADKEYLFYWDANMRTIHTRGVTIFQPAGVRNMSHLIAMFDSGAGVEVLVNSGGTLSLHVYLPNTYVNSTKGLLGYYSRDKEDDFMLPDGQLLSGPSLMSRERIHREFGTKYRLLETQQTYLGQSLFFHDVVSHSEYDDYEFDPLFSYDSNSLKQFPDIDRVCSDSEFCRYDYVVTGDKGFAENTKKEESIAQNMQTSLLQMPIRCPALDKPLNGRKSEIRYWPGIIVRFTCNDGYRLVGYEYRRCREDGLWSWGVDPECVPNLRNNLIIGSISLFTFLCIIAFVVLFFYVKNLVDKSFAEAGNEESYFSFVDLFPCFRPASEVEERFSQIEPEKLPRSEPGEPLESIDDANESGLPAIDVPIRSATVSSDGVLV